MLTSSFTKSLAAGAAVLGLAASLSWAGPVEDRQAAMKAVGKAMGALAAIAKKETPFDAAVVKQSGTTIATKLDEAKTYFPEGSDKGDVETYAKAEIWANRSGFEEALNKAQAAAVAMAAVTEEAHFGAALGNLGNGCKGCHDNFRRPKD